MALLDYIVIALYLLAMIGIGVLSSKKIHDADDFALGGRSVHPFIIICSSIATAAGASACLGQAGTAYLNGLNTLWLAIAWGIGMLMLALIAKPIYRTGAASIPDVFHKLQGDTAGRICAIFAMIYCISTLTAQMMGMGTVILLMFGTETITYELAVIIGGLITILYTLQGGFFAVAYTDTAQTFILTLSMVIIFPIVTLNGMASASLDAIEAVYTTGSFNIFYGVSFLSLATVICKYTFSACTGIPYMQRVLASRNEKEAKNSMLIAALGYTIFGCVVMIFAVVARVLFPDLAQEETIVLRVITEHFPVVLAGLGIAGLVAAVMSSIDSYLLVISQIFSHDICGWFKKDIPQQTELKIERITTVVSGLIALFVALHLTSVLAMFEFGATIYSAAIFFPFILSLFWKKTTAFGAICGMVAGGAAAIVLQFVSFGGIDAVILGNLISLAATVGATLLLPNKKVA